MLYFQKKFIRLGYPTLLQYHRDINNRAGWRLLLILSLSDYRDRMAYSVVLCERLLVTSPLVLCHVISVSQNADPLV